MWEARADYADGTSYCGYFDDNPNISDRDMEYNQVMKQRALKSLQ